MNSTWAIIFPWLVVGVAFGVGCLLGYSKGIQISFKLSREFKKLLGEQILQPMKDIEVECGHCGRVGAIVDFYPPAAWTMRRSEKDIGRGDKIP